MTIVINKYKPLWMILNYQQRVLQHPQPSLIAKRIQNKKRIWMKMNYHLLYRVTVNVNMKCLIILKKYWNNPNHNKFNINKNTKYKVRIKIRNKDYKLWKLRGRIISQIRLKIRVAARKASFIEIYIEIYRVWIIKLRNEWVREDYKLNSIK